MSGLEILLDSSRGVYIPQAWAKECACVDGWRVNHAGFDLEDLSILLDGPENEWYWEAWQDVLDHAEYVDKDGRVWRMYQDGDVFAYCEELMTDEEIIDHFGADR